MTAPVNAYSLAGKKLVAAARERGANIRAPYRERPQATLSGRALGKALPGKHQLIIRLTREAPGLELSAYAGPLQAGLIFYAAGPAFAAA